MTLSHLGLFLLLYILFFDIFACFFFSLLFFSLSFILLFFLLSYPTLWFWLVEGIRYCICYDKPLHTPSDSQLGEFSFSYVFIHLTINRLCYFNSIHLYIYFHPSVLSLIDSFHFFMSKFCRFYNSW